MNPDPRFWLNLSFILLALFYIANVSAALIFLFTRYQ